MAARYVRIGNYPDYRDELRGTLAEILATGNANDDTYAAPSDVAGCTLEAKGGKWYGHLGSLTSAQYAAISGSLGNLGAGSTAKAVDAFGNVTNYDFVQTGGTISAVAANARKIPSSFVNLGDSIDYVNSSYSALGCMAAGFAQKNNAGLFGDQTSGMISRFATNVAAYSPRLVHFKGGSNDVANAVPAATTLANILTLKAMTEAIGAEFFISIIPPRGDAYLSAAYAMREKQLDLCAKYGIAYSDPFAAFVDPATGGVVSGSFNVENGGATIVHPTAATHAAAAAVLKSDLIALYGGMSKYPTPKGNIAGTGIIDNPLLLKDTNSDGKADGFSYGSLGTLSLVTDGAFIGKMQQITTAGANGSVVFNWGGSANAGDVMLATAKLRKAVTDASAFDFHIQDSASNRHYVTQNLAAAWTDRFAIMWTQRVASTTFNFTASFTGSTSINLGFGEIQIYNLTALGLA